MHETLRTSDMIELKRGKKYADHFYQGAGYLLQKKGSFSPLPNDRPPDIPGERLFPIDFDIVETFKAGYSFFGPRQSRDQAKGLTKIHIDIIIFALWLHNYVTRARSTTGRTIVRPMYQFGEQHPNEANSNSTSNYIAAYRGLIVMTLQPRRGFRTL